MIIQSTVEAHNQCPSCGKPAPTGVLGGICPACLLAQGLGLAADTTAEPRRQPAFEPPSIPTVAALFPQLEILSQLGVGGMGAVYKARQPSLDRFVALKLLPQGPDLGPAFAERFNREARALARLNHPNIVAVHEFGQVGAHAYFLMEFVDGANLRQLEQNARLSSRDVLQIIPQICDALQYAHDEGVIHRDIKPENVLIDRRGRVKIADFGLAKILGTRPGEERLTGEGQVMGTPHYMAPEQLSQPLTVDHRADIYSLGVVFYEMLTGDLPLGRFQPPSRKVQLDVHLDDVVLRALENDPKRRYQQVSEVKQGVEAAGTPAPSPANLSDPAEQAAPESIPTPGHLRWAGIPLVTVRDGEREVSYNGAVTAACASLACIGAGFALARLINGQPAMETRLCYLAGLFILGRGIHSAMEREPVPTDASPMSWKEAVRNPFRWARATPGIPALMGLTAFVLAWTSFIHYRTASSGNAAPAAQRAVAPPLPARFGPEQEITVKELIDFDTGKAGPYPATKPNAEIFEGLAQTVIAAVQQGFDASYANPDELELIATEARPLEGSWETITPALAQQSLATTQTNPVAFLKREGTGPNAGAYVFRTRSGTLGAVKILAQEPGSSHVLLRLKTAPVPSPGSATPTPPQP